MAINRAGWARAPETTAPKTLMGREVQRGTGITMRFDFIKAKQDGMSDDQIKALINEQRSQGYSVYINQDDINKWNQLGPQRVKDQEAEAEQQRGFFGSVFQFGKGLAIDIGKTFARPFGEGIASAYSLAGKKEPEWLDPVRMASPEMRAAGIEGPGALLFKSKREELKKKFADPKQRKEYEEEVAALKAKGAEGAGVTDLLNVVAFLPGGALAKGMSVGGKVTGLSNVAAKMSPFATKTLMGVSKKMPNLVNQAQKISNFTMRTTKGPAKFGAWGAAYGGAEAIDEGLTPMEVAQAATVGGVTGLGLGVFGKGLLGAGKFLFRKGKEGIPGQIASSIFGRTTDVGKQTLTESYKIFRYGTKSEQKTWTKFQKMAETKAEESLPDFLERAQKGFSSLKAERFANFEKNLAKIHKIKKSVPSIVDDAQNQAKRLMKEFDIKTITKDGKKTLSFKDSIILPEGGGNVIKKALEKVNTWDDFTPMGVDKLKRTLGKYANQLTAPGKKEAKLFVTKLKDTVDKGLKKEIPGYKKMMREYAEALTMEKDISNALKIGSTNENKVTAMNALKSVFKKASNDEKQRTLAKLEKYIDGDFKAELLGRTMRQWSGEGLAGKLGALTPTSIGVGYLISPYVLLPLMSTSPKVVGSFVKGLGMSERMKSKLAKATAEYLKKIPIEKIPTEAREAFRKLTPAIIGKIIGGKAAEPYIEEGRERELEEYREESMQQRGRPTFQEMLTVASEMKEQGMNADEVAGALIQQGLTKEEVVKIMEALGGTLK